MAADDLGLFGPESVTWRVHREPILWLAGLRALLLQSLHPRALAGVVQNSSYQEDPWGRLWRTARFYGEVVYGTTTQAETAGSHVRHIHDHLRGVDPDNGETFRIDEPDLLRWIWVTATESFVSTAQRAGLGLTPAQVDRYFDEQRAVARLVGLDENDVPHTAPDVAAYYESVRPGLRSDRQTAEVVRFLLTPSLPWGLGWTPVRPMWVGVMGAGFSLLPAWARRLYRLPGLPTTDLGATLGARALRTGLRALPLAALEGPLHRAARQRALRLATVTGDDPRQT